MKQNERSNVYQLISFLFEYPSQKMLKNMPEIKEEVGKLRNKNIKESLTTFIASMENSNLNDWRDQYIAYFDFGRSTNLYVTYSRLGEQRQRGIELLKLKEFYQASGYDVTDLELPDYLPLMIEFCSQVSAETSNQLFKKYKGEINSIRNSLAEKGGQFTPLFDALNFQMEEDGVLPESNKNGNEIEPISEK
ncbi:nitrate reductase molybdenum cofactor assembly chaperone [Virgibacillus sp. NKC19-3]|uniref:nitrate reductase molybdenum cofactor assembly chaperone n=1 Tax=Virgibacillus saliphilus TaxID=2831674 RepID=UPI001C9A97D7|nr:nitrate reductase molybdenum cofactor assembly chaperone [Virgibacillus sp. NKC19-3]MBY7143102.1 nitrate reductase molybdenum cofactor assembly chaperone [Virgibacillus sp. NKC19-3]